MLPWLVAGFAVLLALLALGMARQASRRIDALSHSYWELRYQYGELRAKLAQLDPSQRQEHTVASPGDSFVPLSSLKR